MKETHVRRKTKITYLSLTALSLPCILVILYSLINMPVIYRENQNWKGYYPVLIDSNASLPLAVENLTKQGFDDLIHEQNSPVKFFSFNSEETVSLAQLTERLDHLDPRFDPYMKQISRFFRASDGTRDYDIIYAKSTLPPAKFALAVAPIKRRLGSAVTVTDISIWRHFLLLGLFVSLVVLIMHFINRQYRVYTLLLSLPWILALFHGGIPVYLSAVLLFFSFVLFSVDLFLLIKFYLNYGYIDYSHGNIIQKGIILIAALTAAVIILLSPGFRLLRLLPIFLCILADFAVLLLYTFFLFLRRKRQEHKLFFSVAIRPTRAKPGFKQPRFPVLLIIFLATASAPLFFLFHTPRERVIIPAPSEQVAFREITIHSLERLKRSGASDYPDLADYVMHRAYQKGYFFGNPFQFPQEGDLITVSAFETEDERIRKQLRVVEEIDTEWLFSVLEEGKEKGIPRLLLSQERAVAVIGKPVYATSVKESDIIRYGVVCFLVFSPLLFFNYHLTPESLYGIKSLLLRRKSQAA